MLQPQTGLCCIKTDCIKNSILIHSNETQTKSQSWLNFCSSAVRHYVAMKYIGQSIFKQDLLVCLLSSHEYNTCTAALLSVCKVLCWPISKWDCSTPLHKIRNPLSRLVLIKTKLYNHSLQYGSKCSYMCPDIFDLSFKTNKQILWYDLQYNSLHLH